MIEQLVAIGAVQGAVLFMLLAFDGRSGVAGKYLGCLCLVGAIALVSELLKSYPSHWAFPLLCALFFVPASGGLLAFLYCRAALSGEALASKDWVLFLPMALCVLLSIDIAVVDPRGFAQWLAGSPHPSWRLQASEYVLFLQAFGFAACTSFMIFRYRREAGQLLSSFSSAKFDLLLALQLFTIAIWVFNALPSLTSAPKVFVHAANATIVLVLYFIAIIQWRNPQLFLVEKLAPESRDFEEEVRPETELEKPGVRNDVDAEVSGPLFAHIRDVVEERELYKQSQLTLSELSEAVSLTRHQVSEAINSEAGRNFYEFINAYRVKWVREMLDAGYEGRLLDLGLDAGFSSKSTFNSVFKKATGKTPGEYQRTV